MAENYYQMLDSQLFSLAAPLGHSWQSALQFAVVRNCTPVIVVAICYGIANNGCC